MSVRSYEILNCGDVRLFGETNPRCTAGSSPRGMIASQRTRTIGFESDAAHRRHFPVRRSSGVRYDYC